MLNRAFVLQLIILSSCANAADARRLAVIAGVERYDHAKLEMLEYAEDDALSLAALLSKAGYHVSTLTATSGGKDPANEPTKENLERRLQQMLDSARRDDTVLVALSGHGLSFGGDSYFCPQDAKPFAGRVESLVSLSALYEQLDQSGAGVKVLLVDACRNDPDPGKGKGIDADTAPRPPTGVAVLFSCSRGERSFEHRSLKHGIFTHFLLEGLKGGARDVDDEVTFDTLAAYVRKQTARETPKLIGNGRQQSPNLKADLSGSPAVLLTASDLKKMGAKLPAAAPSAKAVQRLPVQPREASANVAGAEFPKTHTNSIGMKLALIEAGEFEMGSAGAEAANAGKEKRHPVKITGAYFLGVHEVTQSQYEKVMKINPSTFAPTGGGKQKIAGKNTAKYPVETVTWHDAVEFCERLGASEQRVYRLPTEAEWEYACRAGTTTPFNCGDSLGSSLANCAGSRPYGDAKPGIDRGCTMPVSSFSANKFGLYDMHGNVGEWCQDYLLDYPAGPVVDPVAKLNGTHFVVRGGGWWNRGADCRSAARGSGLDGYSSSSIGFRVVLEP